MVWADLAKGLTMVLVVLVRLGATWLFALPVARSPARKLPSGDDAPEVSAPGGGPSITPPGPSKSEGR